MRRLWAAPLVVLALACSSVRPVTVTVTTPSPTPSPAYLGTLPAPYACPLLSGRWPSPSCTPGALSPLVDDPCVTAPCPSAGRGNLATTICMPGRADEGIAAEAALSDQVKVPLMRAEGLTGPPGQYELNHYAAVQNGGSPNDLRNLWVMPSTGIYGAREKDVEDAQLHTRICSGFLSVAEALTMIRIDWSPPPP